MCSVEDDQIRYQIAIELLYMVFVIVYVEFAIMIFEICSVVC